MASDGLTRAGSKDGRKRWEARIVYRDHDTGRKVIDTVRHVFGETRDEARAAKAELRTRLINEKLGKLGKVSRIKFSAAYAGYIETVERHGTRRTYSVYGNKLCERFGDRWIDAIEVGELQRYLSGLLPKFEDVTIGGFRSVIVNTFEWAADHGHITRPTQASFIRLRARKPKWSDDAVPPKKGLTVEEVGRFLPALKAIDEQAYRLVLVMLVLGCRFAEGSALKRKDFNWATGAVVIRRGQNSGRIGPTKNGKPRDGAVPPTVLEILRGHVAEMDRLRWPGYEEWLFPVDIRYWERSNGQRKQPLWHLGRLGRRIRDALKAIGIDAVTRTHIARHTLQGLLKNEVADSMIRSVIGSSSEKMQDVYGDAKVIEFAKNVERVVLSKKRAARDQ